MRETITPGDDDVLIVVDIQNDFCPGGALAVPRGDEAVTTVDAYRGIDLGGSAAATHTAIATLGVRCIAAAEFDS